MKRAYTLILIEVNRNSVSLVVQLNAKRVESESRIILNIFNFETFEVILD